jgi:hypothetical protein
VLHRLLYCRPFIDLKPLFPTAIAYLTEAQYAQLPSGSAEQLGNARRLKTVDSKDIAEKSRVIGHSICANQQPESK